VGRQPHPNREADGPLRQQEAVTFAREPATEKARTMNVPRTRTEHPILWAQADPQSREGPACGEPNNGLDTSPPVRVSFGRRFGLEAGVFGIPVGACLIQSVFGVVVISIEITIILVVVLTALYGSDRYSSRAFRLLC